MRVARGRYGHHLARGRYGRLQDIAARGRYGQLRDIAPWFRVHGLGFVAGLWFTVYGSWLMVYGLWFMVYGLGWKVVYGLWSRVEFLVFRISGFGSRVFRVSGFGFRLMISGLGEPLEVSKTPRQAGQPYWRCPSLTVSCCAHRGHGTVDSCGGGGYMATQVMRVHGNIGAARTT